MTAQAAKNGPSAQRNVVMASFLGWTLDAFDFFLMVFMFSAIAKEFHANVAGGGGRQHADPGGAAVRRPGVRPAGRPLRPPAGADDRRPALFGAGVRLGLRAQPGGAADPARPVRLRHGRGVGRRRVAGLESIPPKARGFVSGLLQEGYAAGYLLASVVFFLLFDRIGWRGMFMVGLVPALLAVLHPVSASRNRRLRGAARHAGQRRSPLYPARRWACVAPAPCAMRAGASSAPMRQDLDAELGLFHRRAAGALRPLVLPQALEDGALRRGR